MKVLIEIPDKHRSNIKKKFNNKGTIDGMFDYLKKVEKVSVEIIPDNATNEDVVNLMFPNGLDISDFYWWKTPYKEGATNETAD